MTSVVPVLTDSVIVLNAYTDDDIPAHLAGEDEETARRFGWWPQTSTEATVRNAFNCWTRHWETGGPTRTFAARQAATGLLVGGCELRLQPDRTAHVSYWTSASQRRRGHATRALALLLQYARSIGVTLAEADVATDNLASRRVAEKAGLDRVSTFTAEDGTGMIRYQAWLQNI
jgi:RimJ/RimL family protein N-acetyltransferase